MNTNSRSSGSLDAPLERPAKVLAEPFRDFVSAQSSSGWVLLCVTVFAIALSNSQWGPSYREMLHAELGILIGKSTFGLSLRHWVNEGLMAIFFFMLGLELKRELLVGQLSDIRRASSVICSAIGGMVVPAALFLAIAGTTAVRQGWAVPVATDTAFALMILLLLGERVPTSVRAFLVGLAIVDDVGAILIIAFSYSSNLDTQLLFPAAIAAGSLGLLNVVGIRNGLPYAVAGGVLWLLFLELGLHGTLAGVVAALAAPVRPRIARRTFVARLRQSMRRFEDKYSDSADSILEQPEQQDIANDIQRSAAEATAPLRRWETYLEKPVCFLVMPLFAFMNAGIILSPEAVRAAWSSELSNAIPAGLLAGKPAGILLGIWIGTKIGIADLPSELTWRHILGVGMLGGIGFTMSIFIATLSYGTRPELMEIAKQTVILTSFCAGLAGYVWLRYACPRDPEER